MAIFNLGIELGSSNTVIYMAGLGVVLKEPSCIAVETVKNKRVVKCVGIEAKKLIGKTNSSIEVVYPIKEGVIQNFQLTKLMLKHFLYKVTPNTLFRPKNKVVFVHSCGLTREERLKLRDLAYSVNITTFALIPANICALIGMEVEENDPYSHMVVNMGGGVTDISIINNNHIIRGATINVGGNLIDNYIRDHIKEKYNLELGINTIDSIKFSIGSLLPNDISAINVIGIDTNTLKRTELRLFSQDILTILEAAVTKVCDACESLLEMCSSEVLSDVNQYGIYLCGGLGNITGIDRFMSKKLNLPVQVGEDPDTSVIMGLGNLLNNQKLLINISRSYN